MRIKQEIVLGIGGVRALEALNIQPTVFHMNEGHAAFLALERIRVLLEKTLAHVRRGPPAGDGDATSSPRTRPCPPASTCSRRR